MMTVDHPPPDPTAICRMVCVLSGVGVFLQIGVYRYQSFDSLGGDTLRGMVDVSVVI